MEYGTPQIIRLVQLWYLKCQKNRTPDPVRSWEYKKKLTTKTLKITPVLHVVPCGASPADLNDFGGTSFGSGHFWWGREMPRIYDPMIYSPENST